MSQELAYYRHSARISAGSTLAALASAGGLALFLGAAYSGFILVCHLIYINALASLAAGFILALFTQAILRKFAIRNRLVGWGIVALTGALTLWAAWLIWVYIFLWARIAHPLPLWWLVLRPDNLWRIIRAINEMGAWSLSLSSHLTGDQERQTFRGLPLWIVWFIETAALVGPLIFIAGRDMLVNPYCETCRTWCRQIAFAALQPTDGETLKRKMEFQEFAYLETIGKAGEGASQWTRLTVQGCPKCSGMRTLCLEAVREVPTGNGRRKSIATPIVNWMLQSEAAAKEVVGIANRIEEEEAIVSDVEPG